MEGETVGLHSGQWYGKKLYAEDQERTFDFRSVRSKVSLLAISYGTFKLPRNTCP